MRLEFLNNASNEISGYSDADWGSDQDDHRSGNGYVFKSNGGVISWCRKRQSTIALSLAEAEYMTLSFATQEAIWLKQFGEDLCSKLKRKILIDYNTL